MTESIERCLAEHNSGKTKSMKGYIPRKLFFFEEFDSRIKAREREKYLKEESGKELIKKKWSHSSTG